MKVVLLAGGFGSRLSEHTDARPKPMIEIGAYPILWHIMNIYAAQGIREFIICAGYKGTLVKEYFSHLILYHGDITVKLGCNEVVYHEAPRLDWTVTVADTGLETNTGGRVRRIRRYLDPDEPFCLTYGDAVADIDLGALLDFHARHGARVTMTTVAPPARFGAVQIQGERVASFVEKPITGDGDGRINGGFFVVHPSALDLVEGDATSWETETLAELARRGELAAYRHDGFWQPMDTLREKMILEAQWATGRAPWKIWS